MPLSFPSVPGEGDRHHFDLQPDRNRSSFPDGKQPARCRCPTSSAASVTLCQTKLLHPLSDTKPSPDPLLCSATGGCDWIPTACTGLDVLPCLSAVAPAWKHLQSTHQFRLTQREVHQIPTGSCFFFSEKIKENVERLPIHWEENS